MLIERCDMVVIGRLMVSCCDMETWKSDAVQEASAAQFWNVRGRDLYLGLVECAGYHRAPGLYMIADALVALGCKLVGMAAPCCDMLSASLPAVDQACALDDLDAAAPLCMLQPWPWPAVFMTCRGPCVQTSC
jgi:hypothetical protein